MREVSCNALTIVFHAAERQGIPEEKLLKNIPYPIKHLHNHRERIDWDAFVQFMGNAGSLWTDDELREIGHQYVGSPLLRPFMLVGRFLFSSVDFYRWLTRPQQGAGAQLVTCINPSLVMLSNRRLQIHLELEPGYRMAREFFVITIGTFSNIPRMIGLAPAEISMQLEANGARYDVTLPEDTGVIPAVRRAITWPFTSRAIARELRDALDALQQRYLQLEESRALTQRQATQLRTAFTIGSVVHGDLDLAPTMQTIVHALVDVGSFSAAEIELTNDLEDHPIHLCEQLGALAVSEPLSLSLAVRGKAVGKLRLWVAPGANLRERLELLESVVPTVCMAVGNALTFKTVLDYKDHLEQRVTERTAELASARDSLAATVKKLELAQAARDRIFANINHEIRTPLSLILLTVNDLERRLADHLDEGARARLAAIVASVNRLLYLIDGMLLLSAGEEGKLRIALQGCDLAGLIGRVVLAWQPGAEQAGVDLSYHGPERFSTTGDQAALERAVANLLSNAIKFTPAGGSVTVELVPGVETADIIVRDTGIGIDEEFKKRIFGRFEQGRAPVRPGERGSGLGLSIVKEIIEAHGGAIEVESNPGGGSRFSLRLPIRAAAEPPKPEDAANVATVLSVPLRPDVRERPLAAQPIASPAHSHATILVAEDDPDLRSSLTDLLSGEYRLVLAHDGLTALRLAKEHVPDMLVTDLGMPGMDGVELTKRFLALPGNRLAPVILLTAYAGIEHRLAGLEAGAVDYVVKPFQPAELLARVRAQLSVRELALKLHESEKLAALGTLAAGLTHEIRNPANGVVNAIRPLRELLPKEALAPGTPAAELFDVISACAEQIATLSRQLLGFVRQGEIVRVEATVGDIVERAVGLTHPLYTDVTLERDLQYAGSIYCSAPLLAQVVMNLLENAAHAAGPGGRVRITTRLEGDRLILDVTDSGPGVSPAARRRIFEPFFTTKPPGAGTGLGLSTSRLVVERHQGTLELVDGAGPGATFRVELPLARATAARPQLAGTRDPRGTAHGYVRRLDPLR